MKTKIMSKLQADPLLVFIVLLAAFLNGYNIWTEEYANTYYTTAVGSMLQSFHNFFFNSLDSAGSVTVDKPPVTFWIQTVSAYVFGLHGWSVILPQVLAGVGSVLLMYRLVKPGFGLAAARISALAMACTPIAVAVSRTNNIDSMLVFTLLLGTWLLFRGIERSSIGSLLGAFAVIGAAFNMKMMQAYMVLPAFYLLCLVAYRTNGKKKVGLLAGATAILLVVSLSWAVIVDSIPADKRPYIGSSKNNSVLELALGYNGLSRLTGNQGPGNGSGMPDRNDGNARGADGTGGADHANGTAEQPQGLNGNFAGGAGQTPGMDGNPTGGAMQPPGMDGDPTGGAMQPPGMDGNGQPDGPGRFGNGSGGMFGTGQKGPLRLFQSALSGQASWLLPFVGFACLGLFADMRRRNFTQQHKETLFWLAWLVPGMVFFSIAGFFHHYYLIMLAPPIAALVGAGWARLWDAYRSRTDWQAWLLPAAILATAAFEWYIVHPYDATIGRGWSIGIAVSGILAASVLFVLKHRESKAVYYAALAGLLALFVGPLYWAATPIAYGQNSMLPQAGPPSMNDRNRMGPGMEGTQQVNEKLLAYLKQHQSGEKYVFATTDYNTAAPYIVKTGESVMIMGGFTGSDPVYTVEELEAVVAKGEVKFFLISDGGFGGPGGRGGSPELTQWIKEHGTVIPAEEWQQPGSEDTRIMPGGRGGSMTLYEVK